ncbi:MAG TPA: amino acid permease C-terminal domain-containing protein, partial [Niabella sp.]|nr:amino acid permease C-terminal domain-containing protein [Niabella sp.]
LDRKKDKPVSKFKVPYINGRYIIPLLTILSFALVAKYVPEHFSEIFKIENFPMLIFWIIIPVIAVFSFLKKFSLIPVLGMVSCFYLMAQESHTNWLRFVVWLVIGLVIYFAYSRFNSKLAKK